MELMYSSVMLKCKHVVSPYVNFLAWYSDLTVIKPNKLWQKLTHLIDCPFQFAIGDSRPLRINEPGGNSEKLAIMVRSSV